MCADTHTVQGQPQVLSICDYICGFVVVVTGLELDEKTEVPVSTFPALGPEANTATSSPEPLLPQLSSQP